MRVGLQIGALGPFVPGVDAHQRGAEERLVLGAPDRAFQPRLIFRRCRAVHDQSAALAPRVVVPAGDDGADQRERRRPRQARGPGHVVIIVDLGRKPVIQVGQPLVDQRDVVDELVRRELDRAIHAEVAGIGIAERLRHDEDRVLAMAVAKGGTPPRQARRTLGNQRRPVDHQHRPPVEPDVARIGEMPRERRDQSRFVGRAVILPDQHLVFRAVPAAGPVLVRPHQAEREIDAAVGEEGFQRPVQQAVAVEPVEIEDEARQAGPLRQVDLAAQHVGAFQPVMAEVAGDPGLIMAGEARQGALQVGPLGKAPAPPGIVLRHRVELRQVIGPAPWRAAAHPAAVAGIPRMPDRGWWCGAFRAGCWFRRPPCWCGYPACRGSGGSAAGGFPPASGAGSGSGRNRCRIVATGCAPP